MPVSVIPDSVIPDSTLARYTQFRYTRFPLAIDCEFPSTMAFGNYGRTRKELSYICSIHKVEEMKDYILQQGGS